MRFAGVAWPAVDVVAVPAVAVCWHGRHFAFALAENFHAVIRALRENYLRSAIVEDVEELVRTLLLPYESLPWNTPNSRHFSDFIIF